MAPFYKTTFTYEVLSQEPIGEVSLEQLAYETMEGDWCGRFGDTKQEELTGKQAADALYAFGSDPALFALTDAGEEYEP